MVSSKNYKAKVDAILKSRAEGTYEIPLSLQNVKSRYDLIPCRNCGRVVYTGKCCNNPLIEIE